MKFRKSIIGAILAAVISLTTIAPCNVVYADTSKTASAENDIPTNFKASKTATSITLSWDKVKGADAYKVYMFNSVSGEYEKYKNVTTNSCKITGLSKGTKYYFKVSVLKKKGDKYTEKATSMSNRVSVTTKTSDTKSDKSSTKKETIGKFSTPDIGGKKKDVLKNCGITNYEISDTGIYYGDVMYLGYKSTLMLSFNKNDKLYAWSLFIPCSFADDSVTFDGWDIMYTYIKALGDDYTLEDGTYTWLTRSAGVSVGYDFKLGLVKLSYMSFTYSD